MFSRKFFVTRKHVYITAMYYVCHSSLITVFFLLMHWDRHTRSVRGGALNRLYCRYGQDTLAAILPGPYSYFSHLNSVIHPNLCIHLLIFFKFKCAITFTPWPSFVDILHALQFPYQPCRGVFWMLCAIDHSSAIVSLCYTFKQRRYILRLTNFHHLSTSSHPFRYIYRLHNLHYIYVAWNRIAPILYIELSVPPTPYSYLHPIMPYVRVPKHIPGIVQ